ncbi:hypothetical protein [Ferviditalea candida]|uniref:Uncharacterized protein n=1 Tax=Ferviditalea candida TaxID=3108399 RepID=A0ABU5ZLC3_9BACL|nr:hypothetical protein [Paenibacillaceae bacterium T2]
MSKRFECELETAGYRLKVSVFSERRSAVEVMARQRAVQLLKEMYGLNRRAADLNVITIQEK